MRATLDARIPLWVRLLCIGLLCGASARAAELVRAGTSIIDITPTTFPVLVNGMFTSRSATEAHDPLHVRCIVLEQGTTRIAIAVVDSCMVPRDILDRAKEAAEASTGIPADHMLISATHTHSAPSAMGVLGTDADPEYVKYLPGRLTLAIEQAAKDLVPVKVGCGKIDAPDYTHCRRWIFRPDRMRRDPFGDLTVRANMHPDYQSADALSPSGPVDPALSLLSFQTPDGKPIAVLANFSQHYFGSPLLSADYYGVFCDHFAKAIGANPGFLAIMSQGTSGDQMWMDYSQPKKSLTMDQYADGLVKLARQAYDGIAYHENAPLAMKETAATFRRRVADEKRLQWARDLVAKTKGPLPESLPEVYARETVLLAEHPEVGLKLQAIRIGDAGIAAIPDEVFALTGLKIKSRSPLPFTFNITLANGSEGYIPPPEQHKLGGYTTWAARTAGLEVTAEPRIVDMVLGLLEEVSGAPRKADADVHGAYFEAVQSSKPLAWWRLGEMEKTAAADSSGNDHAGAYEDGVVFALDGPKYPATAGEGVRAAHFAGGRMQADVPNLGKTWSAELWFYNAMPANARAVTGYLFSRGSDGAKGAPGEHLGIGGTEVAEGKLFFFNGNALNEVLSGNTDIPLRTWNHVALVRDGTKVTVYLNGNKTPEIQAEAKIGLPAGIDRLFLGGRNDNLFNLEGRICDAAVYDRALSADEVAAHYKASGMVAPPPVADNSPKPTQPLSPEESLKVMHVPDGFAVDLVAAEPLTMDPVAIAWGADGKLWIVEMADYPNGIDGHMKAGSRIRYLESTHDDGHYDKSTLFMYGVNFPNGIIPWGKGVIVTAAPEIFYAESSTGRGKADIRTPLYTGFTEGNPQLRVNGLRWGIDGWLYCANGWSGGVVRSVKTGQTVNLAGHDFRIRPDEGLIELQSGQSEFGRDCDEWGDWFGCDNSNPLFHFPIDDRYLRRNPYISPPPAKIQLVVPSNAKVYPRSTPQKRYHSFEDAGQFTSACSGMVYRDSLLFGPDSGVMHAFTCEPVHNMVHHELLRDSGVTFTANRPDEEKKSEFLASEDQWFRPVMVRTGPDGALWVVDMYRYIIEHPDWLPALGKSELAKYWRMGEDKGRIYRVYPQGHSLPPIARLDHLTTEQLVGELASPRAWERDTAQMMLVWRKDPAAIGAMQKLIAEPASPLTRMTVLCTLDLLGGLKADQLETSLRDPDRFVRRQAVRLCESRAGDDPKLIDAAVKLTDDPDAKVRLQLALTLGEWKDPRAGVALARLALRDADDVTLSGAIMSSALTHYPTIADALVASGKPVPPKVMQDLFGIAMGVGNRDVMARLLESVDSPRDGQYSAAQLGALSGWLTVLEQHNGSLAALRDAAHDALADLLAHIGVVFEAARKMAADSSRPAEDRVAAAGLLGREAGKEADDLPLLASLLAPQNPGDLQLAAVRAIGKTGQPGVPDLLIKDWAAHSTDVRQAAIEAMMGRENWAVAMLQAIESGRVAKVDLSVARRQRLLGSHWPKVRELATGVLGNAFDPARQKVVDAYLPALSLAGDVVRGKTIFSQNCATCHRLGGIGQVIGPNLLSVAGWTPEQVLVAVMDPNRAVEPRYLSFTATLNDGQTLFGIISAESPASITIKGLDGKETTVLRSAIKSLAGTNRSLMPDGLEAALSKQDLADVIRFVLSAPSGN